MHGGLVPGPDGIGGSPKQYPNMMQGWVVSSTCENPEAAIRLMDYLYTQEGDELTYLGVEGLMYEWVDEENDVCRRLGDGEELPPAPVAALPAPLSKGSTEVANEHLAKMRAKLGGRRG